MDFTKYLYVMMGSRLEEKIDKLYKSKTDFLKKLEEDDKEKEKRDYSDLPINNPTLSNIISGKTMTSPYLMSQKTFVLLSKEFGLTHREFIFGSDSEIINFFKFSFLLILLNNTCTNPYVDNFSSDSFFSSETNRLLFKEALNKNELLNSASSKLLLNIVLSLNEEIILDFYLDAFKHLYDDSLGFSIGFARFAISNKLDTNMLDANFLFDYLFDSKNNYQIFVKSFNAFIDTNSTVLLDFFDKTINQTISEKPKNARDSTLSKINNNYFVNLFSSSSFLNLLDNTLSDETFILFLKKAEQIGKKIETSTKINNYNLGYYDKNNLEEDIELLQKFYNNNQNNIIHSFYELKLHILRFLDIEKLLESHLIEIDTEDDTIS